MHTSISAKRLLSGPVARYGFDPFVRRITTSECKHDRNPAHARLRATIGRVYVRNGRGCVRNGVLFLARLRLSHGAGGGGCA